MSNSPLRLAFEKKKEKKRKEKKRKLFEDEVRTEAILFNERYFLFTFRENNHDFTVKRTRDLKPAHRQYLGWAGLSFIGPLIARASILGFHWII